LHSKVTALNDFFQKSLLMHSKINVGCSLNDFLIKILLSSSVSVIKSDNNTKTFKFVIDVFIIMWYSNYYILYKYNRLKPTNQNYINL